MELSYWEYKTWLSNIDFTVVGSGIVGLCCAINLKARFPKSKILVLEKGILPQGASTKNAGFACFGSISEIISDLEKHTEEEVVELVQKRFSGISRLRKLLGDETIDLQILGGHEVFHENDSMLYEKCLKSLDKINEMLHPIFGEAPFFKSPNQFGFKKIKSNYITHRFEGQLNTGKMMLSLLDKANREGIYVLNNVSVTSFQEKGESVEVLTEKFQIETNKLLIATNGFASQFFEEDVKPARAQVLVTKPIEDLQLKGTFHFDEGYYYFRNIDNRVLFGGGRNLDYSAEETTQFGQTDLVQNELERLLKEMILPDKQFEIDRRWSGIMGVGPQKKPIVKQISANVFCGIRLGGMGVAIGSLVGDELASLLN
ncbi:NAD(P)/FAD-dependent oxidoreductase [Croceivirga thetidis]|uniref:FAD-binding oxidoreductase n=1 Tax=Croceivirga thetidis TaxID=2721623 RepID=A0ABX1GQI9_9FLAO|nr:FAD-dependent oxidoreductase [Croceivirga thetidis]NKI31311.1 FAD-binding oxidoreductase [Croceivirga thetidis]